MLDEKRIGILLKKVSRLKQRDEYWEGTSRLGRVWIADDGEPPYRPYMTVVVCENGAIISTSIVETRPAPTQFLAKLLRAMRRPMLGGGRARRPKVIYLDDPDYVTALAPQLASLEVRCEHRRRLPIVQEASASMEAHMNKEEPIPGLVKIPQVTPPLIGHLFELAASFYQESPWQWLNDNHPMEIRYPPENKPRYAVVMGSLGEVFGLAAYDTLDNLRTMYRDDLSTQQMSSMTSYCVLFFEKAKVMSFDDLDAMIEYGWQVAAEDAHPVFGRATRSVEMVPPERSDLLWMEGALAAILAYLPQCKRIRHGRPHTADIMLPVATISGEAQVSLKIPPPDF
jgi:hypothetical protein